jgi:glyoxylase I family protein
MFLGLEHTAIASFNPARLADWYVQHLGFHINYEYGGNYFVKALNGSMIEIIPSEGPSQGDAEAPKLKDPGIRHLAIAVEDFDAAHRHLREHAVHFLTEPFENQGNRLIFFADLDGNILHLIHRKNPLP